MEFRAYVSLLYKFHYKLGLFISSRRAFFLCFIKTREVRELIETKETRLTFSLSILFTFICFILASFHSIEIKQMKRNKGQEKYEVNNVALLLYLNTSEQSDRVV